MRTKTLALVVMPQHTGATLLARLEACGTAALVAANCREARALLQERPPLDVVFTNLSLDDGSWWMVRQELLRTQSNASLIVCLPRADGGVSDILEYGASDVLVPPYERRNLRRIVEAAVARTSLHSGCTSSENRERAWSSEDKLRRARLLNDRVTE